MCHDRNQGRHNDARGPARRFTSAASRGTARRMRAHLISRRPDMAYGEHRYKVTVEWIGNKGTGTSGYRDYSRDHMIRAGSKPDIAGSSDAAFLGDAARW